MKGRTRSKSHGQRRATRTVHNKIIIQTLQLLRRAQIQTGRRSSLRARGRGGGSKPFVFRPWFMLFARVRAFFYPSNVERTLIFRESKARSCLFSWSRFFFFLFFFFSSHVELWFFFSFFFFIWLPYSFRKRAYRREGVFIESQTLKNIIRNNREIRRS